MGIESHEGQNMCVRCRNSNKSELKRTTPLNPLVKTSWVCMDITDCDRRKAQKCKKCAASNAAFIYAEKVWLCADERACMERVAAVLREWDHHEDECSSAAEWCAINEKKDYLPTDPSGTDESRPLEKNAAPTEHMFKCHTCGCEWSPVNGGKLNCPRAHTHGSATVCHHEVVMSSEALKALDAAVRFLAGLQLQDQPIAVQREWEKVTREAVKTLGPPTSDTVKDSARNFDTGLYKDRGTVRLVIDGKHYDGILNQHIMSNAILYSWEGGKLTVTVKDERWSVKTT